MVVSDRSCDAIKVAESHGIKTSILKSSCGTEFSAKLIDLFKEDNVDAFLSFYTKLFSSEFVNSYPFKVYNFHPSILPACPGMDGFGDTIKSGSKFIGSTLHLVDEGLDTGKPLIQSVYPLNSNISLTRNRHIIFVQQCKIFIQFVIWLSQDRIDKNVVREANYLFEEFSPNLDSTEAKLFSVDFRQN